jgi:phosphatidylglycerophosphate synthase
MTEGETWVRELLCELHAGSYRSTAWRRFLARSFERARTTRRERRHEHRQALAAGVVGLAVWAGVASVSPWLALAGALWWLLVTAMVDWHLGMLEDDRGRPLRRLGLPNAVTLARAAVVPVLPIAAPALLGAILIPAGLADAIDGPLARRRGEETRLGRWLDWSTDSILVSAAALGAARHGLLPGWATALVLAKQLLPWPALSLAYFVRLAPPSHARFVSWQPPGLLLFVGLVLATLHLRAAVPLVAVGSVGGLGALTVTLVRAGRLQPAAREPSVDRRERSPNDRDLRLGLLHGEAHRRVGVDGLREPPCEAAGADRERALLDQLACARADDLSADEHAAAGAAK